MIPSNGHIIGGSIAFGWPMRHNRAIEIFLGYVHLSSYIMQITVCEHSNSSLNVGPCYGILLLYIHNVIAVSQPKVLVLRHIVALLEPDALVMFIELLKK